MFVILGVVVVILTIYFLIKQYEARMVLFTSGVVMAILAGKPMAALDAFATRMTAGGLIMPICSVMGFAFVMKVTGCDQHLVKLVASGLYKVRFLLIPGATLATFAINIALPSAAGVSAAVGAILIPLLIASGVHPALAGAAVLSGTYGSLLSPGLSHNPFVAELAGVDVMDVIATHATASIAAVIVAAISITIVGIVRKENKGYQAETVQNNINLEEKPNILYAIVPVIPLVLLVLGSSVLPAIKMGVPQAMLIGTVIALAVTRKKPDEVSKAFFNGMGNAYTNIMGIIICAAVFVSGMEAIGIVDTFIQFLINSESMVKLAASFGPFILAVIAGSGDAVTFAFNEAVTPHAAQFGLDIVNMGSVATIGGALGRTMSPITGATIVCAGLAGVSPMELAKRNAPGMIIAMVVAMFLLF
ncbi:MAG: C4-dicarboxylate transporter DcuC [Clostridia bacterium]|nr:C4-dicarboxylate transporter DcuC [Clostridia bacterium]